LKETRKETKKETKKRGRGPPRASYPIPPRILLHRDHEMAME
jgi:hypothetical protein